MNHPTETIAMPNTSLATLSVATPANVPGRAASGPALDVAVVVLHEDVEYSLQMLVVQDQQPVKTL